MKTLVLYTSLTGSTEKYAKDIASAVNGDACSLKSFKWKNIKNYSIVVFGGWIQGGTIQGLNKFLQHWDKELKGKDVILFSCGMTIPTEEGRHILIEQNLLDLYHVRYYQFRGCFDINKLKFPYKLLIQSSLKMIANDPDATEDQKALSDIKYHPIECYDGAKVEKVVSVIRTLEVAPKAPEEKK